MNPEQDNFADLRRLLALKRHEQPPPGYFDQFSSRVIARIQAGERLEDASLLDRLPWLERLWRALETKPVFAGAFGVTVCGLLASGLIMTDRADPIVTPVALHAPEQAQVVSTQPRNPLFEAAGQSDGGVTVTVRDAKPASLFQQFNEGRPLYVSPVSERRLYYGPGVN